MGKKHDKDKADSRKINVEIAPGNQQALDRYIQAYNHRPDRATPKIKYTDVVNEALDTLLKTRKPTPRNTKGAAEKK
jgi:hypothetical protein